MTPVDEEVLAFSLASWLSWRKLIDREQFDKFVEVLKEGINKHGYEIAELNDD